MTLSRELPLPHLPTHIRSVAGYVTPIILCIIYKRTSKCRPISRLVHHENRFNAAKALSIDLGSQLLRSTSLKWCADIPFYAIGYHFSALLSTAPLTLTHAPMFVINYRSRYLAFIYLFSKTYSNPRMTQAAALSLG